MCRALNRRSPAFIPSEESAAPGFALCMAAGYAEEVLFRLAIAPLLFRWLHRRLGTGLAIAVTAVVVGLLFAIVHEAGPPASAYASSAGYFATRFVVPGVGMTVVFFVIGPRFLVAAHCTAHLLIPALFV